MTAASSPDTPPPVDAAPEDLAQQQAVTRQEHVAWCKERALEYVDAGDVNAALTSLISDLRKHPGTVRTAEVVGELGVSLAIAGHLSTPEAMREWIDGVG